MRFLYIYPHPDDESFGPAAVMHKQRREGHEVFLLTLTRGGATKQRHKLGLDVDAMGLVREQEMREVGKVLDLSGLTVLNLPDGRLKEIDPRTIEAAISAEIDRLRPDILVSYPVHGISGFHDHLVTHAVVKRVFCERRGTPGDPRRFAMLALEKGPLYHDLHFPLHFTREEEIDCVVTVEKADIAAQRDALACYCTYAEVIEATGIADRIGEEHCFDLFAEEFAPPIADLVENLPE